MNKKQTNKRQTNNKSSLTISYILAIVLLSAILLYSVYHLAMYLKESIASWKLLDEITQEVVVIKEPSEKEPLKKQPNDSSASQPSQSVAEEENSAASIEEGVPIEVDFERLLINNKDVKAWLYCKDTMINYPVAQAQDNDYYLHRLLNGSYNRAGTLFMECTNKEDFSDWNTLIYGHNMKNNTMFGTITDYRDQEYYDKHPIWYLLTPEGDYKIELISGFVTDTSSVIYSIPQTAEDKDKLVDEIMKKSNFKTNASISSEDKLITFSTCTYDYDEARYVLIGILKKM